MSGRKHHRLRLYWDRASGMHRALWNSQTTIHRFFWLHDVLQSYITLCGLHEVASPPGLCWYPAQQVGCLSAPHDIPRTCCAQVGEPGFPNLQLGLPCHEPLSISYSQQVAHTWATLYAMVNTLQRHCWTYKSHECLHKPPWPALPALVWSHRSYCRGRSL